MEVAAEKRTNKDMDFAGLLAQAILSTRSDAIVATDRDGIIRFWNPGAEKVFGHSRQERLRVKRTLKTGSATPANDP
jgi:PAS domain-containing protein